MKQIVPQKFNFSNVKCISPSQLNQHYILYTKYIDAAIKADNDLQSQDIYKNCNQNYSAVRCAEKASTFCTDGIKLHELYFENLTGNNTKIYGNIETIINSKFGSYQNFVDKFKCIGLSMRGWVTFCYDKYNDDFCIYGQDSHDCGILLGSMPLIVLDVYEHAYMIDFGINRSLYIDIFFENLDFGVINRRLS